jgi:hypothetical protein
MKKISAFFMLTFFVLSSSYAMQTSDDTSVEKEKTAIKLKIKMDAKEAFLKGKESYSQKNYDFAYQYFKYAAKKDYTEAQLEYATMLFDGCGCDHNLEKALEIVNIVKRKVAFKKDDDIDAKNIYRVAKTLWHEIVSALILDLMQPVDLGEGGGLLSALLGARGQESDEEEAPEMSEAVRSMFV